MSLNISNSNLVPYSKGEYDMAGIKALAAAIPECKCV